MIFKANSFSATKCWTIDYSGTYYYEGSSSCWSYSEFRFLCRSFSWFEGSVWSRNWSRGRSSSWLDYLSISIKKSKCWSRSI